MCSLTASPFERAVAAIDAANADDPTSVSVAGGEPLPLAQAHGELAARWVSRLHPQAAEEWLLAARAHHLRRWELPRERFPAGRVGYHDWKREQRRRHAHDVGALLVSAGYDAAAVALVQSLVRRDDLRDPGAQAVEDGACLAFMETQLDALVSRMPDEQVAGIVHKTLSKMSPAARAAAATIEPGPGAAAVSRAARRRPGSGRA